MDNNFDTAKAATQEMFGDDMQPVSGDEQQTEAVPPTPTEQQEQGAAPQEEQQAVLDDATNTAEAAAMAAADKDNQLQQALQQIQALQAQNQQLQGAIDEMSRQNEERIAQDALEPPVLDVNALAFADEDTVKQAQAKYAADMAEYNRKQILQELSPFIEQAKDGMYQKEKSEVISALSQIPELQGIGDMLPQLDKIIENNKALSSDDIPIDEKYITAYAIARGVNSINTPPAETKEPTVEELMALYNSNPAFQELVEKQRLEQLKSSQQAPPFSASSGAVNAALNIKEKPKTFEEASKRTREMFGMN